MLIKRRHRDCLDFWVFARLRLHAKKRSCFCESMLVPRLRKVLKRLEVVLCDLAGRHGVDSFLQTMYGVEGPDVRRELVPPFAWVLEVWAYHWPVTGSGLHIDDGHQLIGVGSQAVRDGNMSADIDPLY